MKNNNNDIYICGGLSIYLQTINIADEVILSVISSEYEGDIKIDMNFNKFNLIKEVRYCELCFK